MRFNLVMDLVDNPGMETFSYGSFAPTDNVTGYNMVQIQDALRNQKTLTQWRNKLFYDYQNDTEQNLEPLFNYWASF